MREAKITVWVHDYTDEDCPDCGGEMGWPYCKGCDYTDCETHAEFGQRKQDELLRLLERNEVCGGVRLEEVCDPNTDDPPFWVRQKSINE